MIIKYGSGTTKYGSGISIIMDGNEVATAIDAWLVTKGVNIQGPRTIAVNDERCKHGHIYVDPSGSITTPEGEEMSGRGAE